MPGVGRWDPPSAKNLCTRLRPGRGRSDHCVARCDPSWFPCERGRCRGGALGGYRRGWLFGRPGEQPSARAIGADSAYVLLAVEVAPPPTLAPAGRLTLPQEDSLR